MVLICTWTGVVSGKASMSRSRERERPGGRERDRAEEDQEAVPQRDVDDPVQHGGLLRSRASVAFFDQGIVDWRTARPGR